LPSDLSVAVVGAEFASAVPPVDESVDCCLRQLAMMTLTTMQSFESAEDKSLQHSPQLLDRFCGAGEIVTVKAAGICLTPAMRQWRRRLRQ